MVLFNNKYLLIKFLIFFSYSFKKTLGLQKNFFSLSEEIKRARLEQVQLSKLDMPKKFQQQENLNNLGDMDSHNQAEEESDFLILTNEEKILSKVLLRNILYSNENPLPNNNQENSFHKKISEILLTNFNFSSNENIDENNKFNYNNSNIENSLIFQGPKKFYIDWTSSKLSEGKFNIKISSQSKNITFEDLFTQVKNKKEENELALVENGYNKINSESDSDFFSSEEDLDFNDVEEKLKEFNYPSEFFDFSNTNKTSKFNLEINFDRKKPNQVLFFCEKLFINDIISAEDLSYIKSLAPIVGRNFKFTQNQNLLNNQYETLQEALNDIRIYEKMEGLSGSEIKLKMDLNLNYLRNDHKFAKRIPLNNSDERKFSYIITSNDDKENLGEIKGVEKIDNGIFLEEFIEKINSLNYNRNFKLFMLNKDHQILLENEYYETLLAKIGEKNSINFYNNKQEMEEDIKEFNNPTADLKLLEGNYVEANIGYLNFSNEILEENYMNIKKQVFKEIKNIYKSTNNLRLRNNYVKNVSLIIDNKEFRINAKEVNRELKI